jgi:1-acyl-sn-glycerol-3-phosphate acyltransferase
MRILRIACLNFLFYSFLIIFSLAAFINLGSLLLFLVFFLSKRNIYKFLRHAIRWYGAVIIRILPFPFIRIDYKNYGQDDPAGPFLFVCNHRAACDPFLIAVFPYEIVQVVNIWPFRLPALGIIAKIAGYLSVREIPYTEFAAKTRKLIAQGVSIAAFPEGTRSRNKSLGQFHSAIFRTALETHAAIVPVCITGNENVPPISSPFLRPGIIRIHRLPALTWQEYKTFSPFKLKNYVREIIAKEVLSMDKLK